MVILSVHSESKRVHFKAPLLSKAYILNALLSLLVVLCPLLIAFRSQGFWIKVNSYDEWPTVNFKHKFLFCAFLQENYHLFWSSYDFLNRAESRHLRPVILMSRQEDLDRDGRKDTLFLSIKIPVTTNETIRSIKSFFVFDYRLEAYSKLRMEILIPVEFLVEPTGEVSVFGDLKFIQKVPLPNRGTDNRYNFPLVVDPLEEKSPYDRVQSTLSYENLLNSYLKRDFLCKLDNVQVFSRIGRMDAMKNELSINLRIRYMKDRFEYKTGFWELMKWAWVQYSSLFLIFAFFAKRIRSFVFENNLLYVVEEVK